MNPVAGARSLDISAAASAAPALAFADLGLSPAVLAALTAEGYVNPTPIQQKAIPEVLAGRDLLGCAQTGTGKTAAFAVPMIERLVASAKQRDARRPRSLVLSPTRELSAQIAESFQNYGRGSNLKGAVIFGGVGQGPQIAALSRGLDVLVATPGRLIDLMNQGAAFLDKVEILVLDEADRMLDMGFLPDVRRILQKLPKQRQTLFFSATMPSDIERLSREILVNPVRVDVAPVSSTAERIEQSVYLVEASEKRRVLERILRDPALERAIVFTRTKHGANRLVKELERGEIPAEAIHGNKSQGARQRALDNFKTGRLRVLIATDIAARGIDVDGISHVVNYDLPNIPESYVHRIGRTARAGAAGIAISLCSREERGYLRDIERLTRTPIRKLETPEATAEENHARIARPLEVDPGPPPRQHGAGGGRGYQGNRASSGPSRGPAPRRFDDRAASPRAPQNNGLGPRPQSSPTPSRFDGDRGPSQERRFDDRAPRQFDSRGPRPSSAHVPQAPREQRPAPARGPQGSAQPEMYIRRSR
jgi:ATP-dependent RNA helicase RhlE